MVEIKSKQQAFRKLLNLKMDKLNNNMVKILDSRITTLKNEMHAEMDMLGKNIEDLDQSMTALENKQDMDNGQNIPVLKVVKILQYKSLDQEARSRRNNVVVYNVPESNNECTETVFKDFLENKLGMTNDVAIQIIHRLGPRRMCGE